MPLPAERNADATAPANFSCGRTLKKRSVRRSPPRKKATVRSLSVHTPSLLHAALHATEATGTPRGEAANEPAAGPHGPTQPASHLPSGKRADEHRRAVLSAASPELGVVLLHFRPALLDCRVEQEYEPRQRERPYDVGRGVPKLRRRNEKKGGAWHRAHNTTQRYQCEETHTAAQIGRSKEISEGRE